MRSLSLAGLVLVATVAGAAAQPWYGSGHGGPPPPHGGWGGPPPHERWGPPRHSFYDEPPPQRRRCWYRPGPWGPERVCRRDW